MDNEYDIKEKLIYDEGYKNGYVAAKKVDEKIILNLQQQLVALRESLDEVRDELSAARRYN